MSNLNFCGYSILRIFITCEISEIKSLAKLSGFTVDQTTNYMINALIRVDFQPFYRVYFITFDIHNMVSNNM